VFRCWKRLPVAAAVLLIWFGGSVLAACSSGEAAPGAAPEQVQVIPPLAPADLGEGEKLSVVATTSIIGDVVAQVGGEAIDLTVLMQPGQDPHGYEPAARDIARLEMADVIFVNGFDLEETALAVIDPLADSVLIVPVSAGIEPRDLVGQHGHDDTGEVHAHGGADPHVWFDVDNVKIWVDNIADVLSALDPAHADVYAANGAAYRTRLDELDAYIRQQVLTIPPDRRKLVTNHESFGYFAVRYGFEVVGVVFHGGSTVAEPSAKEVAELVKAIRETGVTAIFVETTVSDELARVIAGEVGYEVQVITLYTGAIGEPGSGADSYPGMMRADVDAIVAGLTE
jgi:zinc/manganese transport system substrate-binding protein